MPLLHEQHAGRDGRQLGIRDAARARSQRSVDFCFDQSGISMNFPKGLDPVAGNSSGNAIPGPSEATDCEYFGNQKASNLYKFINLVQKFVNRP